MLVNHPYSYFVNNKPLLIEQHTLCIASGMPNALGVEVIGFAVTFVTRRLTVVAIV